MITHSLTRLSLFLTIGIGILSLAAPVLAQNYGQIGGTMAGAVNWHLRQQMFLEQNAPYMFRPLTEQDFRPGPPADEPSVLFINPDVQGRVIPKVPSASEIRISP